MRVSLTFEYVTDPSMHPWWRVISNMKDAVAYFGFRQVFHRFLGRGDDARGDVWLLDGGRAAVHRRAGLAGTCPRSSRPWRWPGGVCCWSRCFICCRWCSMRSQFACCSSRSRAARPAARCATALLARWAGESANSLMPAGQLGGPVLMTRHLAQRGLRDAGGRRRDHRQHHAADLRANCVCACSAWSLLGAQSTHFSPARAAHRCADRQRFSGGASGRDFI